MCPKERRETPNILQWQPQTSSKRKEILRAKSDACLRHRQQISCESFVHIKRFFTNSCHRCEVLISLHFSLAMDYHATWIDIWMSSGIHVQTQWRRQEQETLDYAEVGRGSANNNAVVVRSSTAARFFSESTRPPGRPRLIVLTHPGGGGDRKTTGYPQPAPNDARY